MDETQVLTLSNHLAPEDVAVERDASGQVSDAKDDVVDSLYGKRHWHFGFHESGGVATERLGPPGAGEMVGYEGIGMTVPHLVLGLEPSHHFHVLPVAKRLQQACPIRDGVTVLFLDRGEVGGRPIDVLVVGHTNGSI